MQLGHPNIDVNPMSAERSRPLQFSSPSAAAAPVTGNSAIIMALMILQHPNINVNAAAAGESAISLHHQQTPHAATLPTAGPPS